MKEMDIEIELAYVPDVPHLASVRNANGLKWNNGLIGVTVTDIWLPTDEGFEIVPLKSIEVVGREMPVYMVNEIRKITKHPSVLAIDYKKKSNFSSAFVTYTMLFAGDSKNIVKLSNYLISLIGFKVDATFADITPDESRLLCLLAAGMDNFDMLRPIFDNDKEKLNHAFMVLKKKGLVDDYASTTQLGFEYVEQIKGKEGGVIGGVEIESDDDDSEESTYITNTDPTKKMNKYLWEYNKSSINGLVATSELLQCIPIDDIDGVEIEDVKLGTKCLHIHTKYDAHIYIEPEDKSIMFTLHVALNNNEDMQLRILCSIYLGVVKPNELAHIVNMPASLLEYKLDSFKEKGYINPNNKLSSKGMELIGDLIYTKKSDEKSSEHLDLVESVENSDILSKSSIEHSDISSKSSAEMNGTENNTDDEIMND
ncbi:MAG: hypothetical protein Q7J10_09590 [Methanosarcinaceae archaeon]|nr:hypothetical protein [Methanosarcinaceae archaeon]